MIRIQGDQDGDIAVHHACSPNARLRLQWGGILMTMLSAQAIQGVLEGFSAARSAMTLIPRQIPAPPSRRADPFALPTVAIDWTRRPAYAVVPRQELSRDRSRQLRWLDLHMGPVTFQILDQAGCVGAVAASPYRPPHRDPGLPGRPRSRPGPHATAITRRRRAANGYPQATHDPGLLSTTTDAQSRVVDSYTDTTDITAHRPRPRPWPSRYPAVLPNP